MRFRMRLLLQRSCHDADHPRVPGIAGQHDAGVARRVEAGIQVGERFLQRPLVQRLPLGVLALA